MNTFPSGLVLVTDRHQARRPLEEIAAAALSAGFAAIMLREKDLGGRELLERARPLWRLARDRGAPFLVNDRVDVALALPDAGAHVGKAGIPVAYARRLLGPSRRLGYSAHETEEAEAALGSGADAVTLSPVFASASKPDLSPRGLEFLAAAARRLPAGRVLALGGMEAAVLAQVRAAGAHGAAVMGAMMRAKDPFATARALVAAWDGNVVD